MPQDILRQNTTKQAPAMSTISEAKTEVEARTAAEKEKRKADLPGYAGYKGKVEVKLAEKVAEIKAVEGGAKFEADNIKLDTGEYVERKLYDSLNENDKAQLRNRGVSGFNEYKKNEWESQHVKLDYVNPETNENEWIKKEEFEKLSPGIQSAITKLGVNKFNSLLNNAAESEQAYAYQAIEKEMPEYWAELTADKVFVPGSRIFMRWVPTRRTDVALMNPYEGRYTEAPRAGFVSKEYFDSLPENMGSGII